ncbi:MAG TPA: energy transducer TonB [Sphingomonadaceae bacterium]|nr:energy transducer TonB [Sphingomonadaceae bacterium]
MKWKFVGTVMLAAFMLFQSGLGFAQNSETDPVKFVLPLSPDLTERGVHGTVTLRATVSAENKVESATVLQTSGSQELDDYAQSRIVGTPVAPEVLKNGERTLALEVDLYAFRMGLDLLSSYSCSQMVRDNDWYVGNHPGERFEQGKFFRIFVGLAFVSGRKDLAFMIKPDIRDRAWLAAIERCRKDGAQLFTNALVVAGKSRK